MPSPRDPDPYLVAHVQEALAQDARLNELDIEITVRGDDVFVSGTVATAERQAAVTAVVGEVLPDHRVHNEVSVIVHPAPDAPEHLS